MNAKLDFDATKLYEALKYQIYVAMDYCHTLDKNDVLWIEVFGDVTVEGRDQIEVKEYSDSLTDSHENFWNTLNNWLKPEFNHQQFANLILLTTQAYGERAAIKDWDQWNVAQRLAALEAIFKDAETRFENAKLKREAVADQGDESGTGGKTPGSSKALILQRKVMAETMRESLIDALPKVKIITEQPDLMGLIARYKRAHLKSIHEHRSDDFLDDLFGFMTSAVKVTEGWRFTTAEFDRKFTELTARYMKGSVKFPRVNAEEIEREAAKMNVRDRTYAKKLDEIGGAEDVILEATVDLLHAHDYIIELIKDCTTSQSDVEDYSKSHMRTHSASRSALMVDIDETWSDAKLKQASLKFYHARCGLDVAGFGSYEDTPVEFRNGIYHMLADAVPASPTKEFHWRLWK
ncbi:hypothetical protein [Pseudomonas aeruginosa]|uniref:hypothetical protein n=1 Tax=Pseudomonas aeruginosa TaxID=287 RepID=UPI0003B98962|nr:hypothetical protein [Pseudomonas aeruginosa]AHW70877.1 hypothetical protein PA96_2391 [Pseudomonas aeruginosa PA96]ERY49687.1 hypothetical protein Q059_01839 [Pseudomonas aeruginosa BL05]KSC33624.1 hypothetical protein AO889_03315 [Pseudomonas aeruginosa]KSD07920.1 hypothetical protein AO890_03315 [Pseudomonas aeruginosa]KSH27383.1 hypothetical protein AO962_00710 [Pseudomonas aeruginosa]